MADKEETLKLPRGRPPTPGEIAAFKEKCARPGFPGTLEERLKKRDEIIAAKTKQAQTQLAAARKAAEEKKVRDQKALDNLKAVIRKDIEKEIKEENKAADRLLNRGK